MVAERWAWLMGGGRGRCGWALGGQMFTTLGLGALPWGERWVWHSLGPFPWPRPPSPTVPALAMMLAGHRVP